MFGKNKKCMPFYNPDLHRLICCLFKLGNLFLLHWKQTVRWIINLAQILISRDTGLMSQTQPEIINEQRVMQETSWNQLKKNQCFFFKSVKTKLHSLNHQEYWVLTIWNVTFQADFPDWHAKSRRHCQGLPRKIRCLENTGWRRRRWWWWWYLSLNVIGKLR